MGILATAELGCSSRTLTQQAEEGWWRAVGAAWCKMAEDGGGSRALVVAQGSVPTFNPGGDMRKRRKPAQGGCVLSTAPRPTGVSQGSEGRFWSREKLVSGPPCFFLFLPYSPPKVISFSFPFSWERIWDSPLSSLSKGVLLGLGCV